jgi:small-conductance mechanosensitive channel
MKTKLLLPHKFKKPGWILLIPTTLFGLYIIFSDFEFDFLKARVFTLYSNEILGDSVTMGFIHKNLTATITGIIFIISAFFVAFSREKTEDEFIARIRLESLLWATYINYGILLFCFLFFYDFGFFYVMIFNMFTILVIFIIRFQYLLHRAKKSLSHEKQS